MQNVNENTTQPNSSKNETSIYSFYIQEPNDNKETNMIITSKYTWFNFLPKMLFEQFSKKIYLYFIVICCIECIPSISLTSGYPEQLIPLSLVVFINALKDFFEDSKKKAFDNKENNREVYIFNKEEKIFEKKLAKDIKVGDIIKVFNEEFLPVDLILVSSQSSQEEDLTKIIEDELGVCYYESKNLDGETNLKFKQANKEIAKKYRKDEDLVNLKGLITCSPPSEYINEFGGRYFENTEDNENYIPLDKQCLLLRGCKLKQIFCITGIAVYVGHDTKILKNYPSHKYKVASTQSKLNIHVLILLLLDIIICILTAILHIVSPNVFFNIVNPKKSTQIDNSTYAFHDTVTSFFIDMGTSFLFMTNIIPISLLVSLEVIKYIQGIFMSWDINLVDKESFKYPIIQSSTLNEDLGQVGYIFSDKTGTLTKNIMTFKKLCVGGISYGQDFYEKNLVKLNDKYGKVTNFEFYDNEFLLHLRDDDHGNYNDIRNFMLCVCLCNTIFTEVKEKKGKTEILFQGTSPDEVALINAARYFQYIFLKRDSGNKIVLEIFGVTSVYTIIYFLDYTSERKCMSVIVKDSEDRYFLFTKGADSILTPKVTQNPEIIDINKEYLVEYAKQGLRTLMMVFKEITIDELKDWEKIYNNALLDRDRNKIQDAYNLIECDYYLLGCSAIEDQLQDKVPKTIHDFIKVGIKVWVLTGDKPDTSLSIAFASRLITHKFNIIDFKNKISIDDIRSIIEENLLKMNSDSKEKYALLVVTEDIELIMSDQELTNKFYELSVRCNSVICCRVSPKQKAQMVELIKSRQKDIITLAVGDGANDVNMISTAHIGIGIIGREGLQAAKVSDYAIGQFHFLRRLLFVHGRECYRKNSFVIIYTFYKNILVIVPQIAFGYFSLFSAVYIYDQYLFSCYNIIFTTFPIIWFAIADKEFTYRELESEPKYYIQGIKGRKFTHGRFWKWIVYAIGQGIVLLYLFSEINQSVSSSGKPMDLVNLGSFTYLSCVLIVNVKIMFYFHTYSGIESMTFILSILLYYCVIIIISLIPNTTFYNAFFTNIKSIHYYFCVLGYTLLIVLADVGTKYIGLYFGLTKDTKTFADEFDMEETNEDRSKKDMKDTQDDRFLNNFYLGGAFSQEAGQARHIAKKLVP